MKKSYAVISQKGGTGKTTTAVNLAAGLAERKNKILLIDADPQMDATFVSGLDLEESDVGLSALLEKKTTPARVIKTTGAGYDMIPADEGLVKLNKPQPLANIIKKLADDYDYIIVDCPPNIGDVTVQALEAVDEVIIPAVADALSVQAFQKIAVSIESSKKRNKKLKIAGILLNRYRAGLVVSKAAFADLSTLAKMYQTKVFESTIPENTTIKEAQYSRESLFSYDKASKGAIAYNDFIVELTGEKETKGAKENGKETIKITRRNVQGKGSGGRTRKPAAGAKKSRTSTKR